MLGKKNTLIILFQKDQVTFVQNKKSEFFCYTQSPHDKIDDKKAENKRSILYEDHDQLLYLSEEQILGPAQSATRFLQKILEKLSTIDSSYPDAAKARVPKKERVKISATFIIEIGNKNKQHPELSKKKSTEKSNLQDYSTEIMSKKKISNNASLALYYTLLAHKAGIILTHLHFLSDNNINNPEENNNIQNNNMSDTKKELSNNLLLTLTPDYPLKPKTAIILVTALSIACIAGSLLIKKGFEYNTHYKEKNHKLEQELQQLSAKNNHIQRLLLEKFGQHTSTKEDHVAHYYQNKKTDALLKKIFSLIPAKSRLKVLDFSITTGSNQLIIAGECREPLQQELFHKKICDHLKSSGELITTQSCSLFMQKESIHFFMTLCFNNTNKNKSKYIS